ncbi:MAG: hypothetical protein AB7O73_14485 [Bacteroidia bacterium]
MKKFLLYTLTFLVFSASVYSQAVKTRNWRKAERDSFENAFLLFEDKKYDIALPIYEQANINHPNEPFIEYMYGKTALYRGDKHKDALNYLQKAYDNNKRIHNIDLDLAKAHHLNYNFDQALELIEHYLSLKKLDPADVEDAQLLKVYVNNAKALNEKKSGAKIFNMGDSINSAADEYVPIITADESIMVFTYAGPKSKGGRVNAFLEQTDMGIYMEDAYVAFKQNDTFLSPRPIESLNTNSHDAPISLSPEGHTLYMFRDNGDDHGDIYESPFINEDFGFPVKIKGDVNSFSWDGHCSVTSDGQTMYFSSERPGGFGGKDLWKATLMPDSTWGNIVNLGDSINTKYDEDAPFIHPDGLTLFWSSKCTKSSGGYDIFMSTMEQDSTFKVVENIGYPINTPDDDIYFVVSASGKHGYYSSARDGGKGLKDIYMIETDFPEHKLKAYLVKGNVTSEGKPIEADFKITTQKGDSIAIVKQAKTNPFNGKHMTVLPGNKTYTITFDYLSFPTQTFTLDASNRQGYTEKLLNIKFDTAKDTVPAKDSVEVDTFKTSNPKLANIKKFSERYGNVSAEGLEFKVQVAAYKYPKNYEYKHLKGLGKIDRTYVKDKITLITIGGSFKTLREAWDLNKKCVNAGQDDAFVTAFYKGKRIYLEELEKLGIFKTEAAK